MATDKKPSRPRAKRAIRPAPSTTDPAIVPTTQPAIVNNEKKWDLAKWDHEDSQILIDVLLDDRRPGDGKPIGPDNATSAHGFKGPVWKTASEQLQGSEKKLINGKTSLPKTPKNCKTRWNADKDSKKSEDYAQCKGRPFPLFNNIAPLIKGHQATAKYVKTAIFKKEAPPRDHSPTPSTSATKSSSAHPHNLSPDSSESDIPDAQQPLQPIPGHYSSSSDHESASNRHGKSVVALKQRTSALACEKKKSVDIIDGLSTELHDMSSFFKLSISSTSSAVNVATQAITNARPSVHSQAVSLIYKSSLTCPQCFSAVKLFTAEPLMAETYLSTPAEICDDWILSEMTA
ncbi:hypothetical protein DFH28DRAFT_1132737 [Melampsora americana]|nr:hypothetical protein DFH28DRAFT_1132737 [Melampsora americana]